jgi:hypothetical protein
MRDAQPIRPAAHDDGGTPSSGASANPLDDPRALTILTTEHWSLLSARALVYNEAFSRVGMFLTFLSATLVVLGLVSTATGFNRDFLIVAALTFAVDLVVGLATLGRVIDVSQDDLRYLAGMNRLRHAYHEALPGLERYFISGQHDDAPGVWAMYGDPDALSPGSMIKGILHGFTTMSGLMSALCAMVTAVLVDVVLLLAIDQPVVAAAGAIVTFVLAIALSVRLMVRIMSRFPHTLKPEFPSPPSSTIDR